MIRKESVRKIGAFMKPHGVKGEIGFAAQGLQGIGDNEFVVCEIDGICVPFFIEGTRCKSQATQIVKLAAVDCEEAARKLSGKDAFVPAGDFSDNESTEGLHGLVGYSIVDREGCELGVIVGIDDSTINTLLVVDGPENELLIPAVAEWIIETDPAARRITIDIPDGLLTI